MNEIVWRKKIKELQFKRDSLTLLIKELRSENQDLKAKIDKLKKNVAKK